MSTLIVISALGKDRPGIVNQFSKAVLDAGGNIEESRMSVLGGEFALMVLVSGDSKAIDAIERDLGPLQNKLALTLIAKRTEARTTQAPGRPYAVNVVAMDHPGIVHHVSQFFSSKHINVEEMDTNAYAAPHTGTRMFSLSMTISVPAGISIGALRDEFADFCDELNLDSTIEPRSN